MKTSRSTGKAEPVIFGPDERLNGMPLSQTMVPNSYGVIWYTPKDDCYWADGAACQVLNIPAEGCGSQTWIRDLIARVEPEANGEKRYHTFRNTQGSVVRARLVPSRASEKVILVDDLKDIANRVSQLKQKEREYRELLEHASCGIHRLSTGGCLLHANPALVRLNGFDSEAAMLAGRGGESHLDYVDPARARHFAGEIAANGKVVDLVSEVRRHDTGERIWVSEMAWLVNDEAGLPSYIAGTVVEITERIRHLERMKTAAETDSLTGLVNRAAFGGELQRRIDGARDMVLTVLLVDFDRFKDINDVFGHARGDEVLRICARRLDAVMPAGAKLARLGGDEFAVLTSTCEDGRSALDFADRIAAAVDAPIEVDGACHLLGASIGIAQFPAHAGNGVDLMRNADLALYSVKDGGRGHARVFDTELATVKRNRHAIEQDLRGAHRRGELELFYQPMVDGRSGRILCLEALCRWRHPTRGLVDPGAFVDVAEESGLMLPFGEWIMGEACRHAASLPGDIKVAVNVSALQVRSQGLAGIVAAELARNRLSPSRLELEITESLVLKNEEAAFAVLNEIRALGVKIALDDFGTGYSTLSYLQRFAFDKVKIDQSFVHSLKTNAVNRAITRAVISIGRDLGLDVVAEGIETEADRQALLGEGCHLHQGYYYGRPKPLAEAAADLLVKALSIHVPSPPDAAGKAVRLRT